MTTKTMTTENYFQNVNSPIGHETTPQERLLQLAVYASHI